MSHKSFMVVMRRFATGKWTYKTRSEAYAFGLHMMITNKLFNRFEVVKINVAAMAKKFVGRIVR